MGSHDKHAFSTQDRDHDLLSYNCAEVYGGAWWYLDCHNSNLNGLYLRGPMDSFADGVVWNLWRGYYYSLKKTEMKIRPMALYGLRQVK